MGRGEALMQVAGLATDAPDAGLCDPMPGPLFVKMAQPFGAGFAALRHWRTLAWLDHRGAFVIGMPMLALLSLATSLYIPRIISPAEFGAYALLLNLSRYAARSDLGLSQLADRRLASGEGIHDGRRLLDLRIRFGKTLLVVATPLVAGIALLIGVSPLNAALATAAGIVSMICGGPSSIFRAQGRVWEYTALAFVLSIGFIVPRLLGFAIGGVTGSLALVFLWYGAVAAVFCISAPHVAAEDRLALMPTLRLCFPMFVFAGGWILYLSADRWIASVLSSPYELGLFALGANLAVTAAATFGQIGEVRYPLLLRDVATSTPFAHSATVEHEALLIAGAIALAVTIFVPLAPRFIALAFPSYIGAAPSAVALAASCVSMAVVAWFLPVAVARSNCPAIDAVLMFGPAFTVMVVGMVVGNRLGGIQGQAWASCISSIALLGGFVTVMRRCEILRAASAVRLVVLSSLMLVPIVAVAFATQSSNAKADPRSVAEVQTQWTRTFSDSFQTLSLWNGATGSWQPGYPWGGRTNKTNRELEYYGSPHDSALPARLQPFLSGPSGLSIVAQPVPAEDLPATGHLPYVSGMLNSRHSFTFTYGYVVMRASVPRGKGLWPAFWLLPISGKDPPELDVMEVIGDEASRYYATLHSGLSGTSMNTVPTSELFAQMHDYGVLWTAKTITWYFDGAAVASIATPADMHQPMYLLVNLAVGGKWPGTPDATTIFPATMKVQSIAVYQDPAHTPGSGALMEFDR